MDLRYAFEAVCRSEVDALFALGEWLSRRVKYAIMADNNP
jgi:hypothetical protein